MPHLELDFSNAIPQSVTAPDLGAAANHNHHLPSPVASSSSQAAVFLTETNLQDLSLEIEKERHEYLEKSRSLQEQLRTLKNEIEELKVDGNVSLMDQLHREQLEQGDTKYSTIQKVKRGSMQSRVAFFEEL